jgi:hypothetical protein
MSGPVLVHRDMRPHVVSFGGFLVDDYGPDYLTWRHALKCLS